jgi:Tfp pilus assembly protein PilO
VEIEYVKEKLMDLFFKGRKRILSIGIILFTLFITLIISRIQTKQIESLHANKDTELKKNEVLNEISRSEKTIKLYKNLLSQKDASSVMNTVSDIARDSNVRLISIKPAREENQPLYIKYPFVLVIASDNYHAIGKFISKLESQSGIYFINTISIRSQEESRTPDKELIGESKPTDKLIVNSILSIIAFKG